MTGMIPMNAGHDIEAMPQAEYFARLDKLGGLFPMLDHNDENRHFKASNEYKSVSSIDVMKALDDYGYRLTAKAPITYEHARKAHNEGHQKHMVMLKGDDLQHAGRGVAPTIVFINSGNLKSPLRFLHGNITFACLNGCIFGNVEMEVSRMHLAGVMDWPRMVEQIIAGQKVKQGQVIDMIDFKVDLKNSAHVAMIEDMTKTAAKSRFSENFDRVVLRDLVQPRRAIDRDGSLFSWYNVIQENITRSNGVRLMAKPDAKSQRPKMMKELSSIDAVTRVNSALFAKTAEYLPIAA